MAEVASLLETRSPFATEPLLRFLAGRAIPGVEVVTANEYRRLVRLEALSGGGGVGGAPGGGESAGWLAVRVDPERAGVQVTLDDALAPLRSELEGRLRRLFDLDAPAGVDAHLAGDPLLAPLVARTPGLRVAGAFDGWELAVRAILGQQVSVRGATTLSGRLVQRFGEKVAPGHRPGLQGDVAGEGWLFPSPARLEGAAVEEVAAIGLPRARAGTIVALARAVREGRVDLRSDAVGGAGPLTTERVGRQVAAMQELPGIGPWTAHYVAMRVFRDPDVFLAGDLAVRKALGARSPREAERAAERWRPFRAYAVMHLWSSLAGGG